MIAGFSLVLVNDNFFCFSVADYRSCNCCTFNSRITNDQLVIIYSENLVKCISLSGIYTKFLYFNDIAFSISPSATLYCLPPVAIIAYIWHLL